MKTIYFAGGCFWGMERLMSLVQGVQDAQSGYANGHTEHPSYEQVCAGNTGHRETVKVTYDEAVIGLEELTGLFFSAIDPTVKNRQAHDIGTQYQTGIYWEDDADGETVRVSTRRGNIKIKATVTSRPKRNVVFIPFHFAEAAANKLTIDALDPTCKMPELKVCACRIEKVNS